MRAVIFDLDDTLVDQTSAGLNAVLLDRHDDHPDLAPRIRSLDELDPSLVTQEWSAHP